MTKVCKRGHVYQSVGQNRLGCPECHRLRCRAWNHKNRARKREWYDAHRDQVIANAKAHALAHAEEKKVYRTAWYQRNRDKTLAKSKAWRLANPERRAMLMKEWSHLRYVNNKAEHKARAKAWCQAHPEALQRRARQRRARKLAAFVQPIVSSQWANVVSFFGGLCSYCGTNKATDQEHVIPLSKGGAHAIWNIVPSCGSCNSKKHVDVWQPLKRHPYMMPQEEAR